MNNLELDDILAELNKPLEELQKEAGVTSKEAEEIFENNALPKKVMDQIMETSDRLTVTMNKTRELVNKSKFSKLIDDIHLLNNPEFSNFANKLNIFGHFNVTSDSGLYPIPFFVFYDNEDIVSTLIELGADINAHNADGVTALHLAVIGKDESMVKLLLKTPGIKLDIKDANGQTPIELAEGKRFTSIVYEIQQSEKFRKLDKIQMQIDGIGKVLNTGSQDTFLKDTYWPLIKTTSNIDSIPDTSKNVTALHFAVACGYFNMIPDFLKAGANINTKNSAGMTPLMTAVVSDNKETIKSLIYYGANLHEINNDGKTALEIAESMRANGCMDNYDIISILYKLLDIDAKQKDLFVRDHLGNTLLHNSVLKNDKNSVIYLGGLCNTLKVTKNYAGDRSYDIAVALNLNELIQLL